MVVNLLFGNREASGFELGTLEIQTVVDPNTGLESVARKKFNSKFQPDLTLEEDHERISEVTTNPVESGARVADHVILEPERLTLRGFITDTPAAVLGANPGRVSDAFKTLDALWKSREPLSVVTLDKTYESMIITRLNMPRTRPSSMEVIMELQHVDVLKSETAMIPKPEVADSVTPQRDLGRQTAREASPGARDQGTILYKTYQAISKGMFRGGG